ncbi:hypothetical protein HAT2_00673 [Candidatus Similichlamydia laticola]|uniref:Uncharacterized protein n=1 Tax=Candidatus Similichlamydia laticola TaxID=2170265 RepID=A0A369KHC1_9BACT|nr:hypothetical protein HAT2_00673 [Candidatus Similichlamydia laticola]
MEAVSYNIFQSGNILHAKVLENKKLIYIFKPKARPGKLTWTHLRLGIELDRSLKKALLIKGPVVSYVAKVVYKKTTLKDS